MLQPVQKQLYSGRQSFVANSICEYIELLSIIHVGHFFARGEPQEYSVPWQPSIWRNDHDFDDDSPVSVGNFSVGELAALTACQADFLSGQLSDRYFDSFTEDPSNPIALDSIDLLNWIALAQHYNSNQRYPTRLLDVSTDPFVALFFAVNDYPEDDGVVIYERIGGSNNDLSNLPATETLGNFLEIVRIEGSDGLPYHPQEDTVNFIRPPLPNRRTEAQRGAFVWTRGSSGSLMRGNGMAISIPSSSKIEIKVHLSKLTYFREALFPI